MEIYLVQHGESKTKEEDPERPLSDKGKADVEKIAKSLTIQPAKIVHSSKLRARQTAEILASHLNAPTEEIEGIQPLDEPNPEIIEDKIMIVGHLPHLDKFSSSLLAGNPDAGIIQFHMGGVLCLKKQEKWKVKWFLLP